jgi:preprotein translocase subunit SecF
MVVAAVVLLSTRGLNYGVDFLGGTEIHVRFSQKPAAAEVRAVLEPIGFKEAQVQGFGEVGSGEFLIRVPPEALNLDLRKDALTKALNAAAAEGSGSAKIRMTEDRVYAAYEKPADAEKIKASVNEANAGDLKVDSVMPFGQASANEYVVQFEGVATRVAKAFEKKFGKTNVEVMQVEQVGAKVGSELRMQAIGAVLISILLIGIYVWFRFDLVYAPGAMIALIHDPLAVLLVFALFRLQFDLTTIAAILTVIGFSINDTIVVYDRVRENVKKTREINLPQLINDSINETLGRTVLTTGTVLIASLTLIFLGGPITFNFALAFTIGLIVGTYSTIYVVAPITIMLHDFITHRRKAA